MKYKKKIVEILQQIDDPETLSKIYTVSRIYLDNLQEKKPCGKAQYINSIDIFPDEEAFDRIYTECLENEPMENKPIIPNSTELHHLFEEYLSALQAKTFRYAYQCGYIAGKKRY